MIDLDDLEPEFREKLVCIIRECIAADFTLDIKVGTLSVEQQAKLWRRSRTDSEIDHAIFELEQEKCPFLAEILRRANSPVGTAVTDKMPGFSWHNFGEEVEVCMPEDKADLTILKKVVKKHDLTLSNSFVGDISIRKSPFENPLDVYKAQEIDKLMREKWGS